LPTASSGPWIKENMQDSYMILHRPIIIWAILSGTTSQLFFKPFDIERFKNEVKDIGTVEAHPFLTGYYFLNITNKKWLIGEQIFALCNSLYDANLTEVIELVFVKLLKTENP
jgi:hypothetical protein